VAADTRVSGPERHPHGKRRRDITAAIKLVSVGRGFAQKADLALARELGAVLKANWPAPAASPRTSTGCPSSAYIGISGQTVKPELYLAVGLSGQVQHMVGCRESKVIVAINKTSRRHLRSRDYGIVGDLYTVLPLLTAALKN